MHVPDFGLSSHVKTLNEVAPPLTQNGGLLSSKRLKLPESAHALPARAEAPGRSAGHLGVGNVAGGTVEGAEARHDKRMQSHADVVLPLGPPKAGSDEWNECDEEEAAADEECGELRYGMGFVSAPVCLLVHILASFSMFPFAECQLRFT